MTHKWNHIRKNLLSQKSVFLDAQITDLKKKKKKEKQECLTF